MVVVWWSHKRNILHDVAECMRRRPSFICCVDRLKISGRHLFRRLQLCIHSVLVMASSSSTADDAGMHLMTIFQNTDINAG